MKYFIDDIYTSQLPPVKDPRTNPYNNFTDVQFDKTLKVFVCFAVTNNSMNKELLTRNRDK